MTAKHQAKSSIRLHSLLRYFFVLSLLFFMQLCAFAADAASVSPMDEKGWKAFVHAYIKDHCLRCHGAAKQKAGLSFADFNGDMLASGTGEIWHEAVQLMEAGEMPPPKEPQPKHEQTQKVIEWLRTEMERVRQAKLHKGAGVTVRRLSNLEYRQAVQDLLRTPVDITKEVGFLDDTTIDGFSNATASLDLTAMHIEQYFNAAEHIVDRVLSVPEQAPVPQRWTLKPNPAEGGKIRLFSIGRHDGLWRKDRNKVKPGRIPIKKIRKKDNSERKKGDRSLLDRIDFTEDLHNGRLPYSMVEHTDKGPVEYQGFSEIRAYGAVPEWVKNGYGWLGWRWFVYAEGWYRHTIRLSAYTDPRLDLPDPVFVVERRPNHLILGHYPIKYGEKRELTFIDYFSDVRILFKNTEKRYFGYHYKLPGGFITDPKMMPANLSNEDKHEFRTKGFGRGIAIHEIEMEGPIFKSWPPPLFRSVFPERAKGENDEDYVMRMLESFATRAWRRKVTDSELAILRSMYQQGSQQAPSLREACRDALVHILASPNFYLNQRSAGNRLRADELASRLALFLWRSFPDAALRTVAQDGSLLETTTLAEQTRRMLSDDRINTFCQDFPMRWFGLKRIHEITVCKKLHPWVEYNEYLKENMLKETQLFFREVLRSNLSAFEMIDSDWTYADRVLARHYGIEGITHEEMMRVSLRPEHGRGGMLAHASIHTATSNGFRTSPIHRGIFILEQILGTKPPPPAPNVPTLDDAEGARADATLRERLEAHRAKPECASCHAKFDPLGFALEGYDAVGRIRTHEASLVNDKKVKGNKVDVAAEMPGGQSFDGLDGLKKYIIANGDLFRRSLIKKLLFYALDREPTFVDEPLIQELVQTMRDTDDRLQDLIVAIVASDSFRSP